MIHKEDCYKIGKITKAHGLRGEVNFMFTDDIWDRVSFSHPDAPRADGQGELLICEVDGILVPFFIEEYRFRSDSVALVKFDGLDSADAVQFLVGSDVYFENKHVEESDEEEVSLNFFIGFKLIDGADNTEIGTVTDIDDNTDNWLFIVERPDGSEVMIPAHEEFITEIRQDEREMVLDLPLGLLDL